ncbi:Cyclic nucleotide-binding domain [Popillia japonica]|uniref:Cyclic nucleotide-binding domain n=1 Tax=Popillia japonica TaxID=7064 RepID=A0AAW1L176_POPJA
MQPKTIVLRYLFTYFVPDLLSSIPYHRDIFYLQRLTQRRRQIKFILRCTSLLKVTRCITLYAYSKHSVEAYDLNFTRYRVILSLIIFVAQFHFFTCLNIAYIGVATYNVFGNKQRNRTFTMMYSRMFFETTHVLLASKVGFSHQRIGYLGQKLVVGVCWIISRIIFFYVISQLITIISSVRASNIKYRQMVRQLHEYMRYRQLPENLQRRLILYYEFRFERSYFKESEILNYVSEQLRQEILLHGCRKLVENVEFFRNLPLPLIIRIVSALKPDVYMVNDVIIKVNTQPVCMYFIASGCVAIYTKGGQEVCHLEDGNFFGEIGLVTEQLRLASVVAVETSELYRLNEQDFIRAILPYPDLIDKIKKIAFERTEQTMFIEERSILQKKIFRTITERAQY